MSLGIYLRCDCCGQHAPANAPGGIHAGPDRPPGHVLRAEAKAKGWRTGVTDKRGLQHSGWMDFCEACWLASREEREPLTDITGCDV